VCGRKPPNCNLNLLPTVTASTACNKIIENLSFATARDQSRFLTNKYMLKIQTTQSGAETEVPVRTAWRLRMWLRFRQWNS